MPASTASTIKLSGISAGEAALPSHLSGRPQAGLLPITPAVSDSAILKLHRASVTSTPAAIAAIIWELNLC